MKDAHVNKIRYNLEIDTDVKLFNFLASNYMVRTCILVLHIILKGVMHDNALMPN